MDDNEVSGEDAYLGAGEAAQMLQVSPKTVSRWADKGLIPCVTTLGGHRRFSRTTLERVRRDMFGRARTAAGEDGGR